jgi:cyclopropane fatty-acyl-phospholipid synthase-like methyltransferase
MGSQAVDAAEFRDGQRKQWQKGALGWRRRSDFIDAATAPVSKRMVELAHIEPASRVLDVAAGYGEPSLTAAAVAGPEGKVVATDISSEMLRYPVSGSSSSQRPKPRLAGCGASSSRVRGW